MDKNKIIEAAAKLVAKGAYDKAIKEYQKVLDADPKDVRILQKMGELYQKKNDNGQAAHYFTKVAESYASDGFFLKAVALYKQVLKLDSSLVDVNLKLAELHQQLQLMSEAMAYYQVVANHYDKQGDTRSSLDTLRKMVDLDPENVASRIKLAELYARETMNDEAVGEFRRAAEHLKRNNRTDDYLRVAERISALEPQNYTLARELADLYLARGDQKRALAKLQICFKADARDIDTLKLLAVAFQGLGQTSKTVSVYKELARVYQDKGRAADAEGVWRQVEAIDPQDPDVAARRPAPMPAAAPAPPPRAQASAPQRPATPVASAPQPVAVAVAAPAAAVPARESLGKLLTETDVYVKYGLHDKALEHLRKIFSVDPENIDAHEKAYAIYVASNNHAQASEQLLNVLRLHTRRGDQLRAQPYLATILQQNPSHPEVPVFLAALKAGSSNGSVIVDDGNQDLPDDAILVDSNDEEIIVADAPEDALSEDPMAEDLALRSAGDEAPGESEVISDEPIDSGESLLPEEPASQFEPETPLAAAEDDALVSDFEQGADDSGDTTGQGEPLTYNLDDAPADLEGFEENEPPTLVTELPRQQGRTHPLEPFTQPIYEEPVPSAGDPETTGEMPAYDAEQSFASMSDAALLEEAVEAPPEEVVEAPFEPAAESVSESYAASEEEAVEAPPDEELPASEECDEASFFIEQGLFDEAREIVETVLIAYPGHARAAELLATLDAAQASQAPAADAGADTSGGEAHTNGANGVETPAGERDAFDLAAELASELGESADPPSGEVPSADYQVSVEEVFSEFKKGLEKVVKPEDVETHYDLGIAYKEMGLMDDAIGEFSIARQGCIGQRKELDCLSMMAAMQSMKGDHAGAVESYRLALATEHSGGDVEKALRYELAGAYETAGSVGKALTQYLKVQRLDGGYRDVAAMVQRLTGETEPEPDDEPPRPKKGLTGAGSPGAPAARKVGYL